MGCHERHASSTTPRGRRCVGRASPCGGRTTRQQPRSVAGQLAAIAAEAWYRAEVSRNVGAAGDLVAVVSSSKHRQPCRPRSGQPPRPTAGAAGSRGTAAASCAATTVVSAVDLTPPGSTAPGSFKCRQRCSAQNNEQVGPRDARHTQEAVLARGARNVVGERQDANVVERFRRRHPCSSPGDDQLTGLAPKIRARQGCGAPHLRPGQPAQPSPRRQRGGTHLAADTLAGALASIRTHGRPTVSPGPANTTASLVAVTTEGMSSDRLGIHRSRRLVSVHHPVRNKLCHPAAPEQVVRSRHQVLLRARSGRKRLVRTGRGSPPPATSHLEVSRPPGRTLRHHPPTGLLDDRPGSAEAPTRRGRVTRGSRHVTDRALAAATQAQREPRPPRTRRPRAVTRKASVAGDRAAVPAGA